MEDPQPTLRQENQSFKTPPPGPSVPPPEEPSGWKKIIRRLGPLGAVLALIANFFAKLKFLLLPLLKFLPVILKSGGTMLLTIWVYALAWGWWYGVGFVALMFVHECGHLVVARRYGLKVSAPMFIPFMGAFIALKEAPHNAWMEAWIGIGGPLLGTAGAVACDLIFVATGNPLFRALAYSGFFLNLFNLMPVGPLDGGRIVTALSPWLWVLGIVILGALLLYHPNFVLILILLSSLPRLISLFRHRTPEEERYYEVTPTQRWTMGLLYFSLIGLLVVGMSLTHIDPNT